MKIPHSRPILVSFGLASTALVMCGLLLLEWQGGTATVEARMSEAESGQRGYLLTGQPAFLGPYNKASKDVRDRLANLRRLVADNSAQLRRLLIIESLSRAKLAELDSTIK